MKRIFRPRLAATFSARMNIFPPSIQKTSKRRSLTSCRIFLLRWSRRLCGTRPRRHAMTGCDLLRRRDFLSGAKSGKSGDSGPWGAAIHLLPGLSTVSLRGKTRNGLSSAARRRRADCRITMTVPGALDVIRELVKTMPDVLVGTGTVLSDEALRKCAAAGAQFLVTPGFNAPTVAAARELDLLIMVGA